LIRPIGILTAMVEELEPLLTRAQIEEVEEVGKNRYYLGKLGGVPVVMAYSKTKLERFSLPLLPPPWC